MTNINGMTDIDFTKLSSDKLKNIDTSNLKDDSLRGVCNDFESFFMQQLMEVSLKSTKVAGDGIGSDIVKGMYTESLSKKSSGSLGISDMLYKFLSKKK